MLNQLWPIIETGVIPGGVTLVVLVVLGRLWRRDAPVAKFVLPVAITLGFTAGVYAMFRWLGWWPPAPNQRFGHYALMGLLGVGVLDRMPMGAGWWRVALRAAVRFAVVAGACAILWMPRIDSAWSPGFSIASIVGMGVAGSAWWVAIDAGLKRQPGAGLLMALGVMSAGSAGGLVLSGNAALGQQAIVLSVALVVSALVCLKRPAVAEGGRLGGGGGVGGVLAVLFASLWGAGLAYAEEPVPLVTSVLVGLGPFVACLAMVGWVSSGPRWRAGLVQCVAGGLVVGLGALLMFMGRGDDGPSPDMGLSPDSGFWDSVPSPGSPVE